MNNYLDWSDDSRFQKAGLPVGSIRDWKGKKYQKQSNGKWKPVSEGKSKEKKELHPSISGSYKELESGVEYRTHNEVHVYLTGDHSRAFQALQTKYTVFGKEHKTFVVTKVN